MFGNKEEFEDRFITISQHKVGNKHFYRNIMVIKDTETRIQYMIVTHPDGVGITPLLDTEGKPIITPAETE